MHVEASAGRGGCSGARGRPVETDLPVDAVLGTGSDHRARERLLRLVVVLVEHLHVTAVAHRFPDRSSVNQVLQMNATDTQNHLTTARSVF